MCRLYCCASCSEQNDGTAITRRTRVFHILLSNVANGLHIFYDIYIVIVMVWCIFRRVENSVDRHQFRKVFISLDRLYYNITIPMSK